MGNKGSKGEEEVELKRKVNDLSTRLYEHEQVVNSICHSVETHAATCQLLLWSIRKISSVKEMEEIDSIEEKIDSAEQIACCHCTTEWQEYANRFIGSVQSSLHCQSESLYSTFKRVNDFLKEIKRRYKFEDGTSVDQRNERYYIDYIDSPTADYEAKCKDLQSREKLSRLNDILKSKNKEYTRELQEMKQKMEILIGETDEQLVKLQNENKRLETRMNENSKELEGKLREMEERIRQEEVKLSYMEEKSKVQEEKIQAMQYETEGLIEDKISLEKDMKEMKQAITVQLFHNLRGGMIPPLLHELKTMFATKMQMKRHEIQFIICQTETDVNPKIPVFVFCINASRLGTDAASAIHNLKVSSKVSILVFHHKDVHALPSQASERVLTEPMFKDLGGIFDIAFLADKGIYTCDMNTASAVGIEQFLRTQC